MRGKPRRPGATTDKELNDPAHDEILLWLQQHLFEILEKLVSWQAKWADEQHLREMAEKIIQLRVKWLKSITPEERAALHIQEDDYQQFIIQAEYWTASAMGVPPGRPRLTTTGIDWQYLIKEDVSPEMFEEKFVAIGYVDLRVWADGHDLTFAGVHPVLDNPKRNLLAALDKDDPRRKIVESMGDENHDDKAMEALRRMVYGDASEEEVDESEEPDEEPVELLFPEWVITPSPHAPLHFIVMAKIPSVAALIRDCRLIQESLRRQEGFAYLYVISPDTRFGEMLNESHIGFIEYPSMRVHEPVDWGDDE